MATTPVSGYSTQNSATSSALANSALGSLNLNDFLNMLLTELQNQDPLSPMDSTTMLTQIGQITQVGATQNLNTTLNSLLLGQGLNNATGLIGKTIDGLADDGTEITGVVDKVTVANGSPVLNVGVETVQLTNVKAILPDSSSASTTANSDQALQQLLQQLQQSSATTSPTVAS
ncbi:MAG TPA: flagellar hook capping FlgD N-terminal domain-containing protein [Pirellulales bacterium]|jgi:flagellar basal-body rod modification protein FlgD|nr:flagellar hook capping FlgD N-terminal domain-containing protein [Pirellulales bacterium]